MANKYRIDERPIHGRRIVIDGTPVDNIETRGMAAASLTVFAAQGYSNNPEAAPEHIKADARDAAIAWVREFRRSSVFFGEGSK